LISSHRRQFFANAAEPAPLPIRCASIGPIDAPDDVSVLVYDVVVVAPPTRIAPADLSREERHRLYFGMAKAPPKTPAGKDVRWTVTLLGKVAQRLGTVVAPDEQTALERAAEEMNVRPELRFKQLGPHPRTARNQVSGRTSDRGERGRQGRRPLHVLHGPGGFAAVRMYRRHEGIQAHVAEL
jgi:hypothetical protein